MANEALLSKIRGALDQLDPNNDDHWTDDGLPRTGVVQRLANDQTIKRQDIQAAAPGFERPAHESFEPIKPVIEIQGADNEFGVPPDPALNDESDLADDELRVVLSQALRDAEQALADARRKQAEGAAEERAAMKAIDVARRNLLAQFPPITPEQNIKAYIMSENQRRAERVLGRGAPPSQLDAAMARGNSRGWGRRAVRGVIGPDGHLIKDATGQVAMPRQRETRPSMRSVGR